MHEKLVGGALVLLEGKKHSEQLRLSQAIVAGRTKDDIQIVDHQLDTLDTGSDAVAQRLAELVRGFTHNLSRQADGQPRVPISCGVQNVVIAPSLAREFSHSRYEGFYSGEVREVAEKYRLIVRAIEERRVQAPDELARTMTQLTFPYAIRRFIRSQFLSTAVFDVRAYATANELNALGLGAAERNTIIEQRVNVDLVGQIRLALDAVDNGVRAIDGGLIALVQEYTRRFCPLYRPSLSYHQGKVGNRFLNIAYAGDVRDRIFRYPELKQAYTKIFMDYFGFEHNVCFKPTWAPQSAPFADVVATFLGDQMDQRDGTQPGCVMIQHPEN